MSNIDATEYIRDPIHGDIPITSEELQILDRPEMQRLRRVRQLTTSPLVYPGATHTRFSHSLGVMHVGGRLAESIGMDTDEVRTVRIAGLLHDIGHGPFSHPSDRVAQEFGKTHEEYSCEIINSLSDVIPDDISAGRVQSYILGNEDVNIIAGDIDADRMDYLLRDAAGTGIRHGAIDIERIVEFADIADDTLVFHRRAVHALNELLTARLYMNTAINNHHAMRLAATMIERALLSYAKQESIDTLMRHDNYTLHGELMNMDGPAGELYTRVANRQLYERSFTIRGDKVDVSTIRELAKIDEQEYEKRIAKQAGISPEKVMIAKPKTPASQRLDITIVENGNKKPIEDVSRIPQQLESERAYTARLDVYTTDELVDTVRKEATACFESILN